jgi:hypothetical protein
MPLTEKREREREREREQRGWMSGGVEEEWRRSGIYSQKGAIILCPQPRPLPVSHAALHLCTQNAETPPSSPRRSISAKRYGLVGGKRCDVACRPLPPGIQASKYPAPSTITTITTIEPEVGNLLLKSSAWALVGHGRNVVCFTVQTWTDYLPYVCGRAKPITCGHLQVHTV